MTFSLPLPHRLASPNGRPHPIAKSKAVKEMRQTAAAEARHMMTVHGWEPIGNALVTYVFNGITQSDYAATFGPKVRPSSVASYKAARKGRYLPRDADNALGACKAYTDGLRDAGAIRGDEHSRASFAVRFKNDPCALPGVTVYVEAIQSDAFDSDPADKEAA